MKKYFIITGASKGLGKAFAEALVNENHVLFLISRSEVSGISSLALLKNCRIHQISFDLSEVEKLPNLVQNIFDHINTDDCGGLYLINNAGIIDPVMPIEKSSAVDIGKIINVNFHSVVLLISDFIRLSKEFKIQKRILNITSGAAGIPHHGMSMYCSTKAALDMFTKSVALEQNSREDKVEIHAISPGFVDTQMPNTLLEKSPDDFGSLDSFSQARKEGKFGKPDKVAQKIINLWLSGQLKHGDVSHINQF